MLKLSIQSKMIIICQFVHHARLLILADFLLKEVGLAAQRNVLHEIERILAIVEL